MTFSTKVVLLLALAVASGDSARILGIFPAPVKSHLISFTALMKELAARGHHVTVISGFPIKNPPTNYTDIEIYSSFPKDLVPTKPFSSSKDFPPLLMPLALWYVGQRFCEHVLQHPEIQKLIDDKEKQFDLVFIEIFVTECFYGLVHKYKVPFIQISSNTLSEWMGDGVGNPHTPSYIPDSLLGYETRMTFPQRLHNTLLTMFMYLSRELYYLPRQDQIMKKYFKDKNMPPVWEIEKNASLLFLNTHYSLNFPRPLTPNTVEVGGMHIKPSQKLPQITKILNFEERNRLNHTFWRSLQDLQKFMDEATDGVVYFSLGSVAKNADMPESIRQSFVDAFSKLKQKVLWKWEADAIPGLPSNVRTSKWTPQNDILAHPNLKIFITHGGLLSTQEATYHGVPLLAVPLQADQKTNAISVQNKGYAIVLDTGNITADSLSWALDELLYTPRYRENVKHMCALLRDQPESPLERAVFWTEYVIRHKGAFHLRSAALELWWFQYYLLDVLAVILGVVVLSSFAVWISCHTLYRLVFNHNTAEYSRTKKRN